MNPLTPVNKNVTLFVKQIQMEVKRLDHIFQKKKSILCTQDMCIKECNQNITPPY